MSTINAPKPPNHAVRQVTQRPAAFAKLAPLLRELKLDDNLRYLVSVHDAMGTQVNELRRRLTVRRLHGIGFTRSYRELLLVLGGMWLVQSLIAAAVVVWLGTQTMSTPGVEVDPFAQVPKLLAVALAALVVEILLVVVTARVVERRNAVKRLKELQSWNSVASSGKYANGKAGEFLALTGASGTGKSTVLNLLGEPQDPFPVRR